MGGPVRLNHINLQVSDVDAAREFFARFFALRCRYQRQKQIAIFEHKTGFEFAVRNPDSDNIPVEVRAPKDS
jgi:catechol 2,3-dioxygenase-like lactoylglutathione lyase family enzyme